MLPNLYAALASIMSNGAVGVFMDGDASSGAASLSDFLTTAGNLVVSAIGIVWNIITGNVVLTAMIGVSLVGVGFTFFERAKNSAGVH